MLIEVLSILDAPYELCARGLKSKVLQTSDQLQTAIKLQTVIKPLRKG